MNEISVWEKCEIRSLFAPELTDSEFSFFVNLGRSLGANPFKREIWAVKYDKNKPASIFCGRDFYRKKAQEQKEYDGHVVDSIYSNDTFNVVDGKPTHSYKLSERGALVGAYCIVYKKDQKYPFFVFAKIQEYKKTFGLWITAPETMIKKVAEAQALRGAFQGVFEGTYDESEKWIEVKNEPEIKQETLRPIGKEFIKIIENEVQKDEKPVLYHGSGLIRKVLKKTGVKGDYYSIGMQDNQGNLLNFTTFHLDHVGKYAESLTNCEVDFEFTVKHKDGKEFLEIQSMTGKPIIEPPTIKPVEENSLEDDLPF